MTEVNAAIGLANLKYMDAILADRREKYGLYKSILSGCPSLSFQKIAPSCNCSYFPVMFEDEATLLRVDSALKAANVYARRYFWPSVNKYRSICADAEGCPISEDIASRILCLPLYRTLAGDEVQMIADNVKEVLG